MKQSLNIHFCEALKHKTSHELSWNKAFLKPLEFFQYISCANINSESETCQIWSEEEGCQEGHSLWSQHGRFLCIVHTAVWLHGCATPPFSFNSLISHSIFNWLNFTFNTCSVILIYFITQDCSNVTFNPYQNERSWFEPFWKRDLGVIFTVSDCRYHV